MQPRKTQLTDLPPPIMTTYVPLQKCRNAVQATQDVRNFPEKLSAALLAE